jgi:hypothetical protein
VVIRGRRPVRRAGMVGAAVNPVGRGAQHVASQTAWLEGLEGLRNALTEDEFESAKRHLLAGRERSAR